MAITSADVTASQLAASSSATDGAAATSILIASGGAGVGLVILLLLGVGIWYKRRGGRLPYRLQARRAPRTATATAVNVVSDSTFDTGGGACAKEAPAVAAIHDAYGGDDENSSSATLSIDHNVACSQHEEEEEVELSI